MSIGFLYFDFHSVSKFIIAATLPSLVLLWRSKFSWKKSDYALPVLIFLFYFVFLSWQQLLWQVDALISWVLFVPVAFFRLHDGIDKKIPKVVKTLTHFVGGKDNRTAVAIAIGAIAIVLAILFSNNQPKNVDSNKDSRPEVVRAVEIERRGYDTPYYECPSGYDGDGWGWCYRK